MILLRNFLSRVLRRICFEAKTISEEVCHKWRVLFPDTEDFRDVLVEGVTWTNLFQENQRCTVPRFFFDKSLRTQTTYLLSNIALEAHNLIIAEADQVCEHVFNLLGSGPVDLGPKINWHTDFKTGYRWNPRTYYRRIRHAPYPGGYDIKVPWELSRCQHFIRLGQAYWITDDEKYAHEYVAQVNDWIDKNPWPWGVNWSCTMDVAIRVVNWLWGYHFFLQSPSLSEQFVLCFYKSLLQHGRHIYRNLENQGDFTGNHYLSNLVGLVYLGILCPEFKEASVWREFGLRELEKEMFKQIYPDGVNFEASTSYHRLVLEMFLSTTILAQRNGHQFSADYMARLEKMVEFVMYLTKPDGTSPLIGDNDNGRLHRLKVWNPPEREWCDFRYLVAIGAVLFLREDFAQTAADQWEDAIWLIGDEATKFKQEVEQRRLSSLRLSSRAFRDAGIFIMRHDDHYLAVATQSNGKKGNGGHAHNDSLSFELYAGGDTWIVDPGTYTYTSDYDDRHLFRSTSYHNTPQIVEPGFLEQNRCEARLPFSMQRDVTCTAEFGEATSSSLLLLLRLNDYAGLDIQMHRSILFDWQVGCWIICDTVVSSIGNVAFDLRLHLRDVSATVLDRSSASYVMHGRNSRLVVCSLGASEVKSDLAQGWVAPGYGTRFLQPVIRYQGLRSQIQFTLGFCLVDGINCRSTDEALGILRSERVKQVAARYIDWELPSV